MADTPTAVVFAGGEPEPVSVLGRLPENRFVVAADGGLHAAHRLGIRVDLIVGDLDSADPATVQSAVAAGAVLERHPAAKDATDLELSLDAVLARDLAPVIIVGGGSLDRIDHFMANALLLAAPRYGVLHPQWFVQGAHVVVVGDAASLSGEPGDLVTLLAVGGPAEGVTTGGLRWALQGDRLETGSTRGVSNVMTADTATIRVERGTVLATHIRRFEE